MGSSFRNGRYKVMLRQLQGAHECFSVPPGKKCRAVSTFGQAFLIMVSGLAAGPGGVNYALAASALTGDLGTVAFGTTPSRTLNAGDQNIFSLTPAVVGSLQVTLTTATTVNLPLIHRQDRKSTRLNSS